MPIKFIGHLDFQSHYSGVRVKYGGNILICSRYRTASENFESIKAALCILTGLDGDILFGIAEGGDGKCYFETDGGVVETYRSFG